MEIILHKWYGCIVTLNSYFVNRDLGYFKNFFLQGFALPECVTAPPGIAHPCRSPRVIANQLAHISSSLRTSQRPQGALASLQGGCRA